MDAVIVDSEYELLDMGIWREDGTQVWLPKRLFPTRNDAKRFALAEGVVDFWIDVRVRTAWMRPDTDLMHEGMYVRCRYDDEGAFECWEIE